MKRLTALIGNETAEETADIGASPFPEETAGKKRVNLLALGDVGGTLLTGLRLLGGDVIGEIGICDAREETEQRYEWEINQITEPFDWESMPPVTRTEPDRIFDCDVFLFCAAKGVPSLEEGKNVDVRMVQYEGNRTLAEQYAAMAAEQGFKGLFCVVSDPVDPLCMAVLRGSGLDPGQIQGFGLGVMNGRAGFFAGRDPRFRHFLTEGRVYGPHGQGLVVADSLTRYNDSLSRELTRLTLEANRKVRELGFKPYIAPALSSAAIPLLLALRGRWQYSSIFFGGGKGRGGVFFGMKNRIRKGRREIENPLLPDDLYARLEQSYRALTVF